MSKILALDLVLIIYLSLFQIVTFAKQTNNATYVAPDDSMAEKCTYGEENL